MNTTSSWYGAVNSLVKYIKKDPYNSKYTIMQINKKYRKHTENKTKTGKTYKANTEELQQKTKKDTNFIS